MTKRRKKKINWDGIRDYYATGKYHNTDLAVRFKCSESAIRRKAKMEKWPKDLSVKIKHKAVEKAAAKQAMIPPGDLAPVELVEIISEQSADIVIGHRKDISKARKILEMMLEELAITSVDPVRLEEALNVICQQEKDNLADSVSYARFVKYIKGALSLNNRAGVMRNLSNAMEKLVSLERQAYDMDAEESTKPLDHVPLEERVKKYTQELQLTGTDNVVSITKGD